MTLSIDGTPQSGVNFFGTSQALGGLTTSTGSGLVHVSVYANGTVTINVPTSANLTFTARSTVGTAVKVSTFTAPYTSNLSGEVITVTCSGAGSFLQGCAISIGGAATSSQFDTNGSVPNITTSGDPTVTTSNANDILIASESTTGSNPTADAAYTEAVPFTFNNFMVQYKIVSATNTYTATLSTGGPALSAILDAIVQATATAVPRPRYRAYYHRRH